MLKYNCDKLETIRPISLVLQLLYVSNEKGAWQFEASSRDGLLWYNIA